MINFIRVFIVLLTCLIGIQCFSQLPIEHSYPHPVQRIRLNDGTGHYLSMPYEDSDGTWKVNTYSEAHILENTAELPFSGALYDIRIVSWSTDFFDNDAGIEFIVSRQHKTANEYC